MNFVTTRLAFIAMGLAIAFFSAQDSHGQNPPTATANSIGRFGESTVSEIKDKDFHIRVSADLPIVRSSFDIFCRDLDQEFRRVLGMKLAWDIPIFVKIQGKDTNLVQGRYLATEVEVAPDNSISIIMHVKLHDRFDKDAFAREFIRTLLLEQILSPYKKDADTIPAEIKVPDWMIYGFTQLIAHKRMGRPSSFFAGYIQSGQLLSVEQIFAQKDPANLNPLSLAAYEASATALIDTLRTQNGGKEALRALMKDLAASGPNKIDALLRQHFPSLREVENGLEKWWALQVAIMGKRQALEFMSSEETNRLLEDALIVRFKAVEKAVPKLRIPQPKKNTFFSRLKLGKKKSEPVSEKPKAEKAQIPSFEGTIDQFAIYRKRPQWKPVLSQSLLRLQHIKARGFPLYRPLLDRYDKAIKRILKGQLKNLDKEFAELAEMRESIRHTMALVKDYLNLYEAAKAPEKSNAFNSYIRMRQAIEQAEPPKRKDRISTYLDDLEKEFAD